MTEDRIEITTPDGVIDGYVYHTDDGKPRPGIIHYTDIFGIRDANRGMAFRLAEEGYTVLLPNVFYRTGRPPILDRSAGPEEIRARFDELKAPLTPEALDGDATAYVEYLTGLEHVSHGAIGVVGYCFTGGLAMRTAAVRPDRVAAAASFHGGGLHTELPSSPHLVLPQIKARLHFGHAYEDRSMSADAIAKLDVALEKWGGTYESTVYRAGHGWTVPDGPAYDSSEAEKAFASLNRLLGTAL
jgi:carboxymethylenebutenolidase